MPSVRTSKPTMRPFAGQSGRHSARQAVSNREHGMPSELPPNRRRRPVKKKTRLKKRFPTPTKRPIKEPRQPARMHGMRLFELKTLWQAEREEYKRSEVGTGAQRF